MQTGSNSNTAIDLLLVGRVRIFNDREAFGQLVERHQSSLRRYLLYLTDGNHSRADDLAQETFIKAMGAIGSFRGGVGAGAFRGWLFKIGYRAFLDSHRSARWHDTIDAFSSLPTDADSIAVTALHSALGCLDETEKNLILLSAIEELSHGAIAEITELPLGTVKSTIARAKLKLRDYLKNDNHETRR